jgi:hypothetical protein
MEKFLTKDVRIEPIFVLLFNVDHIGSTDASLGPIFLLLP